MIPKAYMEGRFANPVALIVKAIGSNPEMPPANSAIFQLAFLTFGLNPLAFEVLALMMNWLPEAALIVRLPTELMRSQPVPALPLALASSQL